MTTNTDKPQPTSAREALIDALKRQNPHETDEVIKLMNAAASALASSLHAQSQQMDAREALLKAAEICDKRVAEIEGDTSGNNEYFYLDELENAAKAIRALTSSLPPREVGVPKDAAAQVLEAYDLGQFADDFDQPLAKTIRKAVRDICDWLYTALAAPEKKPCPRCKGTGKVGVTSFVDPTKTIEKPCSICHGNGSLP